MLNFWPSGSLDLISGILIKLLKFAQHRSCAVGAGLRFSVAEKRHHGHSNFKKGKVLITVQRFRPLSSLWDMVAC